MLLNRVVAGFVKSLHTLHKKVTRRFEGAPESIALAGIVSIWYVEKRPRSQSRAIGLHSGDQGLGRAHADSPVRWR